MKLVQEKFIAHEYAVSREYKSKIAKDKYVQKELGYRCPHCNKFIGIIENGEETTCKCGLIIHLLGNILNCELLI